MKMVVIIIMTQLYLSIYLYLYISTILFFWFREAQWWLTKQLAPGICEKHQGSMASVGYCDLGFFVLKSGLGLG